MKINKLASFWIIFVESIQLIRTAIGLHKLYSGYNSYDPAIAKGIIILILFMLSLFFVLGLLSAYGLNKDKKWGWFLAIIFSLLSLINFFRFLSLSLPLMSIILSFIKFGIDLLVLVFGIKKLLFNQ